MRHMRILFSAEDFYPRLGGAEAFIDELLTALSEKNEVHAVYIGEKKKSKINLHPIKKSYAFKNIPIFNRSLIRQYFANRRWKKVIEDKIRGIRPDLIITQLIYVPSTVEIAKKYNIPIMVFIHNYEHFCPVLFNRRGTDCRRDCFSCLPFSYKIQYPFYKWLIEWHAMGLKKADVILTDTDFICRLLKRFYSIPSKAFFPITDLGRYVAPKKDRKYITLVNPAKHKGIDIFTGIAERMPDYNFLIVCGSNPRVMKRVKKLKNITYLSECRDIRSAYAKTRVLLAPSTWPEPFGRVIMEAQINGIPCITSSLGGLPEAVGSGGFVVNNLYDIDEWVEKVKRLDDKRLYDKLSKKAFDHASRYRLKNLIKRFELVRPKG